MNGVCLELLLVGNVLDVKVGGPLDNGIAVGLVNPRPSLGFGRPIVRSSCVAIEGGRIAGAVPSDFIAIDRAGAAKVRAGGAAGAGLPGVGARAGGGALILATPAGTGAGADFEGAGTADALAFSMSGTIVARDAGLRFEV